MSIDTSPLPADHMQACVTTPGRIQHLHGTLDDGILNAFFLVPGQARRMDLLGKLFRADEQMTANEKATGVAT